MSVAASPRIVAAIVGDDQRDAMVAGGEQLSDCVGAALGREWPVRLRLIGPDDVDIPSGIVLVASIDDGAGLEPIAQSAARWVARIERYRSLGHDRVLICNRFRHIGPDARQSEVERIRRLNRLAIELSRHLSVEVIDADRLLALCGARTLAADVRGAGAATSALVGHAIADAILQGDMAECINADTQAHALAAHGGVCDIPGLIARHVHTEART